MNKLYTKFLAILLLAFAIGGCKIDTPVYPEGTVSTIGKDKGTGTGTDPGIGLPLGPSGSVQVKVDNGATITYNSFSSFTVAQPGSDEAAGSLTGLTTVSAMKGASDFFALLVETTSTGTYDLNLVSFGKYSSVVNSDGSGKGSVKITTLTSTQIQGSFNVPMEDDEGNMHTVIGSFNIHK